MRYMIVDNGKYSYVKADRQVFTSSNIRNRAAALENYLNALIDQTGYIEIPTTDGDAIRITNNEDTIRRNTVGKLTSFDEYIDENGRWDKSRILLKQNIALHIDEIIAVSRPTGERKSDRGYKHDGFAEKGWTYRTAYFQDFDGSYYRVKLSVAENSSGKVAYNVNQIEEQAEMKDETSTGKIKGSKTRSSGSPITNIMPDSSENVNRKMSLNDSIGRELSEGQQEYFKDSVIRDEQGRLMVMYHGSKKGGGFTIFKDWQYFTDKKQYAERYSRRGDDSSMYAVYLDVKKPFDTRNPECARLYEQMRWELGLSDLMEDSLPDWTAGYDIADYIDENDLDYDGIILNEGGDLVDGKPVSRGESVVVRHSSQIKEIDNLNPTSNSDIRFSLNYSFRTDQIYRRCQKSLLAPLGRSLCLWTLKVMGVAFGGALRKPFPKPALCCGSLGATKKKFSNFFSFTPCIFRTTCYNNTCNVPQ